MSNNNIYLKGVCLLIMERKQFDLSNFLKWTFIFFPSFLKLYLVFFSTEK